jgi:hypothetical protein
VYALLEALLHARHPCKINRAQEEVAQDREDEGEFDQALAAPISRAWS